MIDYLLLLLISAKGRVVREDIGKIVGVALLWGITGTWAGWGLQTFLGRDSLYFSCGSLSVAMSMFLVSVLTRSEEGRQLFYNNKKRHDDDINFVVIFLYAVPFVLAFSGLLWWIVGQFTP